MSEVLNQAWQWSDLNPLTRSVVAAFSGRIGDETRGDLSGDAFIASMTETFDGMTREDVVKGFQHFGPRGIRNSIVAKLSGFELEPITNMTLQLGRLAGGNEAVCELATQAGEQLSGKKIYDAIPALRVLSELAIERR